MERRLPLLVSALLVVVAGVLSLLAYHTLRTQLMAAADEHSVQVGGHLAELLARSAVRVRDQADSLAAIPVIATLAGGDERVRSEAAAVMADFVARSNSVVGIGITTREPGWMVWADGPSRDSVPPHYRELSTLTRPNEPSIGPIRAAGGPGLFYDVSAPLTSADGEDADAWLVVRYRIASGEQARTLASLVGRNAVFLVGSSGSRVEWTDLQERVPSPEPQRDGNFRWQDKVYRGSVLQVSDTPWRVWTGIPVAQVLAPVDAFAEAEAVIAFFTLLFGAFTAWLLGRHVARPIARLRRAADGMSEGDYHERVPEDGPLEVSLLAGAFNLMAERVEAASGNLEAQVEERTGQLSEALEELKAAQEKLVRRERLAFLGQLAGGIGHELRNPLGVMTNAVYYLDAVSPDAPEEVKEYHGILRSQLHLAEKIVSNLLDFARSPEPEHEPVALDRLADDQLERLGADSVEIVREYARELPPALADVTQIGQVVYNLLTNAVQAMDGGPGRVTLRTFAGDNGEVALSVSDSGQGISEEDQEKVFEPLFTTRARGIGLGLALSRSLVEANHGRLSLESCPGIGTTFFIHLPSAGEA